MKHANFNYVAQNDDAIFIIDLDDGAKSVTNDAEHVVEQVLNTAGRRRRIIYRDSEGQWDELIHDGRQFVGFAPYKGPLPLV